MTLKGMIPKPTPCWRLTRYWAAITTSGLLVLTASELASSSTAIPFDEPLCFMKMQDGRVVNLQRLCGRSTIAPTKPTPASNGQPAAAPTTSTPQAESKARFPSRPYSSYSHAQGNPDSDDGRY